MKKFLSILMSAIFVAGLFSVIVPTDADAIPAFARQTEQPCLNCHFQHIPKLNAMGRAFKLGGFTDTAQDTVEDMITIFSNAAFITKWLYEKTDRLSSATGTETGSDRGVWAMPDETAIWVAGRMNEHWGGAVEWGGPALSSKFVYSNNSGDVTYGATGYWTDGLGPFFGMELWNSGVVPNTRGFENRSAAYAPQALGLNQGGATGFAAFAANNLFYASVGAWAPFATSGGDDQIDTNFDFSLLYRVAVTPTVGDWDVMLGVFGVAGDTKCDCAGTGALVKSSTEYIGMDAQAQGAVGNASVEVTLSAVFDTGSDTNNIYAKGGSGIGGSIEVGFLNDTVGVGFTGTDIDTDVANTDVTELMVSGWYTPYQNIRFSPSYSWESGDGKANDGTFILLFMNAF